VGTTPALAQMPSRLGRERHAGVVLMAGIVVLALFAAGVGGGLIVLATKFGGRASFGNQNLASITFPGGPPALHVVGPDDDEAEEVLLAVFQEIDGKAKEDEEAWQKRMRERLVEATKKLDKQLGDPLRVAYTEMTLAEFQVNAGYPERAVVLFAAARETFKSKLGPLHPDTLKSTNHLGWAYSSAGKWAAAMPLFEEALKQRKSTLGPTHPDTLISIDNLGAAYQSAGKLDLAISLHKETVEAFKASLGPDHHDTLVSEFNLAGAYQKAGKVDLALKMHQDTLDRLKATMAPNDPLTYATMRAIAHGYQSVGKVDQAISLAKETLELQKVDPGPHHPETVRTMLELADIYSAAEKHTEAASAYEDVLANQRTRLAADDPAIASTLASFGHTQLRLNRPARAETLLRECLSIRKKREPDRWNTFNAASLLGGALLEQGKHADAEPLLVEGNEGMERRAAIPLAAKDRLVESKERLVRLYEATGRQDKAAEWRKKLTETKAAAQERKLP
jgi:tetratricopeptide (TPR) repeat protein